MKTNMLLSLALLVLYCQPAFAQNDLPDAGKKIRREYANTLYIQDADFTILNLRPFFHQGLLPIVTDPGVRIADQFGASFEHRLYSYLVVGVSYNTWNTVPKLNVYSDRTYPDPRYVWGQPNFKVVGALRYRYGYSMVDLYACYRFNKFRRHKFCGGVGPSYAWGTNYYVSYTWFSQSLNQEVVATEKRPGAYFGATALFKYDFQFLHDRLVLGVNSRLRKYFGLYSAQFEYGIHVGVNF